MHSWCLAFPIMVYQDSTKSKKKEKEKNASLNLLPAESILRRSSFADPTAPGLTIRWFKLVL